MVANCLPCSLLGACYAFVVSFLLKIVIYLIKVDIIQNNILHLQSINSDTFKNIKL